MASQHDQYERESTTADGGCMISVVDVDVINGELDNTVADTNQTKSWTGPDIKVFGDTAHGTTVSSRKQTHSQLHLNMSEISAIPSENADSAKTCIGITMRTYSSSSIHNENASEKVGDYFDDSHDNGIVEPLNKKDGVQKSMIYGLTDTPPFYFMLIFALQQCLLVISTPLSTTIVVSEAVCAQHDEFIQLQLLSATFFMMGLSTFVMTTFGVRLPIFQGPTAIYIIPLLVLKNLDEFKCPDTFQQLDPVDNSTVIVMARIDNETAVPNREVAIARINDYAGTLIMVGVLHFIIGVTGMVSLIARLVGPITIVPLILLFGIYIHTVVASFCETHWPTAIFTSVIIIILALYLENYNTPIPLWTPRRGFYIVWQPLHRIFALFIGIVFGWCACGILTVTNVLSDDQTGQQYLARTDSRIDAVSKTDWLVFPYPGQFGAPGFSVAAVIPFFSSAIVSIVDSIGDYNASAKVSSTPRPPNYALNRGIAVEGLMTVLGGAFGCSHGTVSFGENIGAMGISRVASRSVFQALGIIYMIFAFLGKFGAFFTSIPYSVLGGTQIITFGIFIGITLSYMETINLRSQRNLSILGISILVGIITPNWISNNQSAIDTGVSDVDKILRMLLTNPSFIGGFLACFLDNTIPGSLEERGIAAQTKEVQGAENDTDNSTVDTKDTPPYPTINMYDNSVHVYRLPWVPDFIRSSRLVKILPIFDKKIL